MLIPFTVLSEEKIKLTKWSGETKLKLEGLMKKFGPQGRYVVFDADNTIWKGDLEESLMPYLEMKGVLSLEKLPPELKILPIKKGESLCNYYNRLYDVDVEVSFAWIAQVFSGIPLKTLKKHVDELYAFKGDIPIEYEENGKLVKSSLKAPKIYPAQRELINKMKKSGLKVYVMTAALEELVRMVVSDPKYGLGIKPENVIGVTLLLKDPVSGKMTTARKEVEKGTFLTKSHSYEKH